MNKGILDYSKIQELNERASKRYKVDDEIEKLVEEFKELYDEIKRDSPNKEKIAEEIVDVLIMLERIFYLFKIQHDEFGYYIYLKVKRQIERLRN